MTPTPSTDRRTVFTVTLSLAMLCMGGLASCVILTLAGKALPEMISITTATALGALGSLLVSTRISPEQLPPAQPPVSAPVVTDPGPAKSSSLGW